MLTINDLEPNSAWLLPEHVDPEYGKMDVHRVMLHKDECGYWLTSLDVFFRPSPKINAEKALKQLNIWKAKRIW